VVETADVEQHAAVAQMVGGPVVSTRADTHLPANRFRVQDRRDHVVGVAGLDDDFRIALRHMLVPDGRAARLLISLVTAKEVPPGR
jgi:hypothetical protein